MRRAEEDDDESDDEPRPAKKKPNLLLILGIVGGVLLLVCGGGVAAGVLLLRKVAKNGMVQGQTVTLRAQQEHRIGDLGITVGGCTEESVDSTSPSGRQMGSKEPYTVVRISLKNYNPNRNATPAGQSGHATVTDDLGTKLARVRLTDEVGWECKPPRPDNRRHDACPPFGWHGTRLHHRGSYPARGQARHREAGRFSL